MSPSPSLGMTSDVVVEMGVVSSSRKKPSPPGKKQGEEDVMISKVNPLHDGRLAASNASKEEVRILI